MRRSIIVALFTTLAIAPVMGQDIGNPGVNPTATPTFAYPTPPTPTPILLQSIAAICSPASPLASMVSPGVTNACTTQTFPQLIADGSRFASRALGAEFNILLDMAARVAVASN